MRKAREIEEARDELQRLIEAAKENYDRDRIQDRTNKGPKEWWVFIKKALEWEKPSAEKHLLMVWRTSK